MEIVISAQGVKREIEGPFALCGSAADFSRLRDALTAFLDNGGSYGWVEVVDRPVCAANTKPLPWVTPVVAPA